MYITATFVFIHRVLEILSIDKALEIMILNVMSLSMKANDHIEHSLLVDDNYSGRY